jgi:hypothetical protein
MSSTSRLWTARLLIGLVLFINLQCALVFFVNPAKSAPAYELSSIPGAAAIQGLAVLFLMWNVPYVVALANPVKYRLSLFEALVMQSIGLVGETLILSSLPLEHIILRNSVLRFILFDGAGLLALAAAAWLTRKKTLTKISKEVLP